MKKRLELFPELSPELMGIVSAADDGADGEGGGGDGVDAGADAGDSGEGADKLKAALDRERQRAAEQRRLAGQLKAQLDELKKSADPEVIRAAELRAREAEEKARDAERLQSEVVRKAREEAEKTYADQIKPILARAEAAERALMETRKRHALESAFYANGGKSGVDEEGATFFEAFYAIKGHDFALDSEGRLYVVDGKGDAVMDSESEKRLPIKKYLEGVREKTVAAAFFNATQGSGSGGSTGRSAGGRVNPQSADWQALSPSAKIQAVFSVPAARR